MSGTIPPDDSPTPDAEPRPVPGFPKPAPEPDNEPGPPSEEICGHSLSFSRGL
jgi:hypothetical protein